jgi:hypothetical protein
MTTKLILAALASVLLLAPAASATDMTFAVNTEADHKPDGACAASPGDCTLREGLLAAAAVGGSDIVNVPAGNYDLELGALTIAGDRLVGTAGARLTVIDGGGIDRVLDQPPAAAAPFSSQVTGVTITGGVTTGAGGGVAVESGTLSILNSQIAGNRAANGGGVAVGTGATVVVIGSTIAGNTASAGRLTRGGGVAVLGAAQLGVANSTVSGNIAVDDAVTNSAQGGGIYFPAEGQLVIWSATIANNTAAQGGGIAIGAGAGRTMTDTILAQNSPGACLLAGSLTTTHDNLVQDNSCGLQGAGDVQGVNAALGSLANNGGPTDTRALPAGSLAINEGSDCYTAVDQRGVTRPDVCDIGAFEYVAPRLTVTTQVVNDNGGTAAPAAFSVHVAHVGGGDVAGSPKPGSAAGTSYTVTPGGYVVSAGAPAGYTVALGGACSAAGAVTLGENQAKTCTVVANDRPPAVASVQLPPPVPGKNVNALPKTGTVRVKLPGTAKFVLLDEDAQIPLGTVVDVRKGRVTIVAAAGDGQTADFYGGLFKLGQTKGSKPITVLTLVEKLSCPKKQASAAAKRKKKRRLWGDGNGRFRTKGKHSAATVVGTKWLVEDRCTSTLTRVVRGKVRVRDFAKKKTVLVKTGKKYVARSRR